MANPDHVAIMKQGVHVWNAWRLDHPHVSPDLREANLRRARLHHADLTHTDLRRAHLHYADLTQAKLSRAHLTQADLRNADFGGANLYWAELSGAYLREANLSAVDLGGAKLGRANLGEAHLYQADLTRADLSEADLTGTDFREAKAGWTVFTAVDLRAVKGLETVTHIGPSSIGIDTIYQSGGMIPEVFLRGAGVPNNFIAYIGSLVGKPIEFYSCFISYSTKDQEFADRLCADLQSQGVRCWFAPHHMSSGKKVHEQIDEAIRLHDRLLLILSPDSLSSSWVETEIAKARNRERKEKRRVLFPVRLTTFEFLRDWECFDADTGKDSAREIREYYIPDFSEWKDHDSYQKAFDRLLRDLQAEAQTS